VQIPILEGEACSDTNAKDRMVVNRSFANRYFPDSSPIGHHLARTGAYTTPGVIEGIVGDAREKGLNQEPSPVVYSCFNAPSPFPYFLVRTAGDPARFGETIRRKMIEIEPRRSVYEILPLEEQLSAAFAENRLRAILLASFAVTAMLLATVGLYGTLSYLVDTHRREVGLRLALGAMPGQIAKRFLAQGLSITLGGCVLGLGLAIVATRLLTGMLYGVSRFDPSTLGFVTGVMLVVAGIASLIPAIRAARVDPMQVLRQE